MLGNYKRRRSQYRQLPSRLKTFILKWLGCQFWNLITDEELRMVDVKEIRGLLDGPISGF